jgi:hypothetical protein
MAFRLGVNAQNAGCNAIVGQVDAGTTNTTGRLLIYTGSQPATPATTATGTLLVTINFNNPSFGSASAGAASMVTSPAVSATVAASGTAGWFRITDRNNNAIFDGSITATGGGGDMTFDNTAFVSGGTATISSITITVPM